MEASTVTGPAKNLIRFGKWAAAEENPPVGVELSVATFCRAPDQGNNNAFVKAVKAAGLPLHVIPESGRFDFGVLGHIRGLVQRVQPDIVQTHNVKSHFLFRLAGLRHRPVWIACQHGYTATDLKMKLYNQCDRWSLRSADRVITVCRAFAPALEAYGVDPGRIRVLHNSVNPPATVPAADVERMRESLGITGGERVIASIGRFSKEKGHADLLEALAQLAAPRWKAVLAGSGPEESVLRRKVAALGLSDRVIFAGFCPDPRPLYAIADIVAIPSHSEGSCNVLLEAMAARVPVAATAVGGTPEIVTDGESSLLTPPRDPRAMAQSLERLLENEPLRMRLAARAYDRACANFSFACYTQTLLAIYSEALGQVAPVFSNSVV